MCVPMPSIIGDLILAVGLEVIGRKIEESEEGWGGQARLISLIAAAVTTRESVGMPQLQELLQGLFYYS